MSRPWRSGRIKGSGDECGSKHVLIVGAGPGGLAAAMLLARAGARVTVLEKQDRVGGRTSSLGGNGFTFDLGPTFFLYPRVLEGIFHSVGRNLREEVPMTRLDPQYHLIFGAGGELSCTSDVARMVEEVARLCPADAANFPRFLDDNRDKLSRFRPCLERPFLGLRDILSWGMLKLLPLLRPWRSLDQELGCYFRDPRVRLAFSFQSKYLGMSPFNCPSLFSILSFLEYEYGVWHPTGGCAAVTAAMARVAEEMGVDIRLAEPVEEILFEGSKAVGVRTARGETRADAIVVNADFAQAMTKLVPDARRHRWTDRKLAKKRYSCSTYMLYLGIEGRYDDLAHHTIYMARDYEANLADIEKRHVLSEDPSFYIHNPCVTDPSLALARPQFAVSTAAGDASAPQRRLESGRGSLPSGGPAPTGAHRPGRRGKPHSLGEAGHAGRLGRALRRSIAGRRSAWRTTSARCCTIGRAIVSRMWTISIW